MVEKKSVHAVFQFLSMDGSFVPGTSCCGFEHLAQKHTRDRSGANNAENTLEVLLRMLAADPI